MRRTIRIVILECDTPIDPVRDQFGTYGDIFEAFLQRGMGNLPLIREEVGLRVTKWNVVEAQKYPDLDTFDGLLLTGSRHDSFEDKPWIIRLVEYIRSVHASGQKRILGVCFGHQIIARALGVDVGRNEAGWELSAERLQLTPEGSKLMGGLECLTLHQMHRDIVMDIPEGLANLATSDRCKVQGLYLPKRLLSFQAHPEFNEKIMSEILAMRHQQGIFGSELFQDGKSRAALPHDGDKVAAIYCRFLLGL